MKLLNKILGMILLFFFIGFSYAYAQSEELTIRISRDFGFSGGGKIQGLFSMKVTSAVELTEVVFFIDEEIIGTDFSEPFSIQFNTDSYPPGGHLLYAIGYTMDGIPIKTRENSSYFITAEESRKATLTLIVPIIGISLLAVIISAVIPALKSKKARAAVLGSERNYSIAGGTICSRCKRPFARHLFAPNMLVGKLERCPNCGKWGIYRAYPLEILRDAEKAELLSSDIRKSQKNLDKVEDIVNDELESTKYQDF